MKVWQRPEQPVAQQRKSKPIEEKESYRWLGACRRENVVANHKAFRLVFSRPCARKNLLVPQSSLIREALLVVGHLSACSYALLSSLMSCRRRTYPTLKVCRRFKLNAVHTRHHSPAAACKPRSENWRKPKMSLMMPSTGSTVHFRKR